MSKNFTSKSVVPVTALPLAYVCPGCREVHGGVHRCERPQPCRLSVREVAERNIADVAHRWGGHQAERGGR